MSKPSPAKVTFITAIALAVADNNGAPVEITAVPRSLWIWPTAKGCREAGWVPKTEGPPYVWSVTAEGYQAAGLCEWAEHHPHTGQCRADPAKLDHHRDRFSTIYQSSTTTSTRGPT